MPELIVIFKNDVTVAEMRETIERQGMTVVDTMQEKMERMNLPSAGMPSMCLATFSKGTLQEWIDKLMSLPNIKVAELNSNDGQLL